MKLQLLYLSFAFSFDSSPRFLILNQTKYKMHDFDVYVFSRTLNKVNSNKYR